MEVVISGYARPFNMLGECIRGRVGPYRSPLDG